jgi:hypothetical protein
VEALIAPIAALLAVDPGTAQLVLAGLLACTCDHAGPDAAERLYQAVPGLAWLE